MDAIELIKSRRTVRNYKNVEVEREKLDKILESAIHSPTGMNKQTLGFVVVIGREKIRRLSDMILKDALVKNPKTRERMKHMDDPVYYGAPLLILITRPKNDEDAVIDCGFAAENMILEAVSIGLSTCPHGTSKLINGNENAKRLLGIKEEEIVEIGVLFGYGDEKQENKERKRNIRFV